MSPHRLVLALTLASFAITACGGGEGTEVIVQVKTDLVPGIEFSHVELRLAEAQGTSVSGSAPLEILTGLRTQVDETGGDAFARGTTVGRFTDVKPGSYWVLTQLVDDRGQVIVERPTIIDVPKTTFGLTVLLTRDCRGVSCPAPGGGASLLACLAGDCVDPRCHPEAPEFCPPPECRSDADCSGGSSCAPARCSEEGICLLGATGDACAAGEYCSPNEGCLPIPVAMDSALPDAGPVVCGTICFPPDRPCFAGYYDCTTGVPVCNDLVQIAEGTSCGAGMQCDATGACVPLGCVPGGRCWTECLRGTVECVGDVRSCVLTATPVAEGTPCEPALTCYDGEACDGILACDVTGVCTSPGPTRILGTLGEGDGWNRFPVLSDDGSAVAFDSLATNLVPGDTNATGDIFVYDFGTETLERVSIASDGTEANDISTESIISADGRFVAFNSPATSLVPGDMNTRNKVYLRDRMLGTTERISRTFMGTEPFSSSTVEDMSSDARFILFCASTNEFVMGDTNTTFDGFVYDRMMGTTERMTLDTGGLERMRGGEPFFVSEDGNEVYFESRAIMPDMSLGAYLYAYDRVSMIGSVLTVTSGGEPLDRPAVTGWATRDGRFVGFTSSASNILPGSMMRSQVYLLDRMSGDIERLSVNDAGDAGDDGSSDLVRCSADGSRCVFFSTASNLVADDTNGNPDIFLRDRTAGTTIRITGGAGMVESDGISSYPTISADGRFACYETTATNLAPGDTNGQIDVYCVAVP